MVRRGRGRGRRRGRRGRRWIPRKHEAKVGFCLCIILLRGLWKGRRTREEGVNLNEREEKMGGKGKNLSEERKSFFVILLNTIDTLQIKKGHCDLFGDGGGRVRILLFERRRKERKRTRELESPVYVLEKR